MRTFLILLTLSLLATPTLAQDGRLVFSETEHDFGVIEEGAQAKHVFTFRNEGDTPIHLTKVQPSCGCTTPQWTRQAVAPGDTGHVAAVFDSANQPGPFEKSIFVETDGQPAQTTLSIQGDVQLPPITDGVRQGHLLLEQETIDLGTVASNERATRRLRIQNAGERPLRLHSAQTPNNMVSARFSKKPLFNDEVQPIYITVRTYGMSAGDTFSYPITLETDDEAQPAKTLRVTGKIATSSEVQQVDSSSP